MQDAPETGPDKEFTHFKVVAVCEIHALLLKVCCYHYNGIHQRDAVCAVVDRATVKIVREDLEAFMSTLHLLPMQAAKMKMKHIKDENLFIEDAWDLVGDSETALRVQDALRLIRIDFITMGFPCGNVSAIGKHGGVNTKVCTPFLYFANNVSSASSGVVMCRARE